MAGLKFVYRAARGEFEDAVREQYAVVADAAKAAMVDVGDTIKRKGRAQIRAAGFKRPYQTAFRVDVYPRGRKGSANAAAVAYHKVDYSETFEEGAKIKGKPYLWVPIRDKRTRVGRKQLRLKDFKERGEKLVMVKRPGKPPLLFGRPLSGMPKPRRATQRASYQRYQAGGLVPLFVGIDIVNLPKKFALYPMIAAEAERLTTRYFQNLKAD